MCELISEIGEFEQSGLVSLGPVGVGKSSNLNTIASYLSNRLEQEAAAGSGASTLTISCRSHMISYQGRPVKWKWMDTPGDLFTTLVEKWKRTGALRPLCMQQCSARHCRKTEFLVDVDLLCRALRVKR